MSTTYVAQLVYGTALSELTDRNIDLDDFSVCEEYGFAGIPVKEKDGGNRFQDFQDENEISKAIQDAKSKFYRLTGLSGIVRVILWSY